MLENIIGVYLGYVDLTEDRKYLGEVRFTVTSNFIIEDRAISQTHRSRIIMPVDKLTQIPNNELVKICEKEDYTNDSIIGIKDCLSNTYIFMLNYNAVPYDLLLVRYDTRHKYESAYITCESEHDMVSTFFSNVITLDKFQKEIRIEM